MRTPRFCLLLTLSVAAAAAPARAQDPATPAGTLQITAADLAWGPGPAALPEGVETVVLEGDPRTAGLFTVRLRAPAGTRLAPHTHPQPERVTVLEGGDVIRYFHDVVERYAGCLIELEEQKVGQGGLGSLDL